MVTRAEKVCSYTSLLLLLACALRAIADQPMKLRRRQSVFVTSRHLTSTEDKSRQCGTLCAFYHKDTNQWLPGSISFYRHHSDPVQSGNG